MNEDAWAEAYRILCELLIGMYRALPFRERREARWTIGRNTFAVMSPILGIEGLMLFGHPVTLVDGWDVQLA